MPDKQTDELVPMTTIRGLEQVKQGHKAPRKPRKAV